MSTSLFHRLVANVTKAETRLAGLKTELAKIRKAKLYEKISQLTAENMKLEGQVQEAKAVLICLEIQNGKKQIPKPAMDSKLSEVNVAEMKFNTNEVKPNQAKGEKKDKKSKKEKAPAKPAIAEAPVDVRRLDLRIGKIIEVNKHPEADSLYVEKIDCGEDNPRTVVSGLVNHIRIDEMRNRIVMVLCNLKPVKMRGVTSEAMVMCASCPEKVEVLIPPAGAIPGDLVYCEGYSREPDTQLNPKKKIFETCAPDLKTNANAIACYKGTPLQVPGKGNIVAESLKGVPVK